jgi:hypothetical protein
MKNIDRSRREIYANVEANSNKMGLDGTIGNEINRRKFYHKKTVDLINY